MSGNVLFAAQLNEDTPTIDLHGLTKQNAKYELEFFLDHSRTAGERVVRIIHGRGQGYLKEVVLDTLESDPLVKKFEQAQAQHELGGVTYAELRQ